MSVTPAWAQALDCDQATLESWRSECPPGQSLLQWALLEGKISEERYLEWAREHYGLISIKPGFFQTHRTFPQFNNWKTFHPWSSACCPIYQWNDILYVGCLEPQGLPEMLEIRPVLCSAEALSRFWRDLTAPSSESPTVPLKFDFANVGISNGEPTEPFDEEIRPQDVQFPPTQAVPLSQPTARLDFSNLSFSTGNEDASPTDDRPQNEVHDIGEVNESSLSVSMVTASPSIEFENIFEVQPAAKPPVVTPTTELGKVKPRPTGSSKTNAWSEKLFAELDAHFEAKMIVTRLDEGFVPRYWSAHWYPKNPQQCPFLNINEPNIFRIAYRSQRPFHGPISPNPVNEDFFAFWRNTEYPQQITVQPVVQEGQVIGMVVGVPKEPGQQNKKLRLIAQVSEKVAQFMQQAA